MDDCTDNPLISFVLLAYNQERFIREAVEGAFAQTYSPLEIILSDDCSTDQTFAIIEEMAREYKGPHRNIIVNQNSKNLGLGQHFNKVMEMAKGEIILPAAGDDISLPHRAMCSWEVLNRDKKLKAVSLGVQRFSNERPTVHNQISDGCEVTNFNLSSYISNTTFHINAPARAFKRDVFDYFGPLNDDCTVEDGPILFRCLLLGDVAQASKLGVLYRIHNNNLYAARGSSRLRLEPIFNNYFSDLDVALANNVLSDEVASLAASATEARLKREVIKSGFYCSNYSLFFYAHKIALSNLFSGRAKAKHLRSCFGSNSSIGRMKAFRELLRCVDCIRGNAKAFKTTLRKGVGRGDYKRWSNPDSLSKTWDSRTEKMASLIPENTTSVIEFGAARMILKPLLPNGCQYTPSDLVDRGKGTLVWDLNSGEKPDLEKFDVAVFSGVLEYVDDVPSLISVLSKSVKMFVISYAPTDTIPETITRRSHGWVNDYSVDQLDKIFSGNHFFCDCSQTWKDQIIARYVLRGSNSD